MATLLYTIYTFLKMEKFALLNGVATRYLDTGEKEASLAIVLIHGYLESLDIWDEFINLLKPKFRVLALDLPGHGISEVVGEKHTMPFLADTVHALLAECGVQKAMVVGHSMGGYVALAFAESYATELSALVLLHSSPMGDTPERADNRKREIELILAGKKELLATTNPAKSFADSSRKRLWQEIDYLTEQAMLTEDEGAVAILRGVMERKDSSKMLRELHVPQLLVFGRFDSFIPQEAAETIIAAEPQAQVLWLENSGHMGFLEEPQKVADALAELV